MSIDIDISHNILAVEEFFADYEERILAKSVRKALNRTLISSRKYALKEIHRSIAVNSRAMKRGEFKKELTSLEKPKGNNPFAMSASLIFSGQSLPLLWFVSGNIDKIKQKGIKVKKRKKIKAQVFKGRKFVVKKAFIQKVQSKQVFKRGTSGFKKQAAPSLASLIKHKKIVKHIQKLMLLKFRNNLASQMDYVMATQIRKANSRPLEKVK